MQEVNVLVCVTGLVSAYAGGYWLNYSSAAWGCWATRRWFPASWHTEVYADSEAENDLVHIPSSAFCSVPHLAPLVSALIHHRSFFFFFGPNPNNTSCTLTKADICWWNYICRRSNGVVCHCDACFLVESIFRRGVQAETAHANWLTEAWSESLMSRAGGVELL